LTAVDRVQSSPPQPLLLSLPNRLRNLGFPRQRTDGAQNQASLLHSAASIFGDIASTTTTTTACHQLYHCSSPPCPSNFRPPPGHARTLGFACVRCLLTGVYQQLLVGVRANPHPRRPARCPQQTYVMVRHASDLSQLVSAIVPSIRQTELRTDGEGMDTNRGSVCCPRAPGWAAFVRGPFR
jgi:hypothetical protein